MKAKGHSAKRGVRESRILWYLLAEACELARGQVGESRACKERFGAGCGVVWSRCVGGPGLHGCAASRTQRVRRRWLHQASACWYAVALLVHSLFITSVLASNPLVSGGLSLCSQLSFFASCDVCDGAQSERQKRAAVVKRRGELQAQVAALQAQLAEQQQRMEAMAEAMAAAAKVGGADMVQCDMGSQPAWVVGAPGGQAP